MGETLDTKKIRLVKHITTVQDEAFLDFLEKLFERTKTVGANNWLNVIKSIRQHQTFDDMAREQNDQGFNREEFNRIVDELDIHDPEGQLRKLLSNKMPLELLEPMEEKIDLEKILREQNYRGPNKRRFKRLVKELNIQEPVEDLLALLTK